MAQGTVKELLRENCNFWQYSEGRKLLKKPLFFLCFPEVEKLREIIQVGVRKLREKFYENLVFLYQEILKKWTVSSQFPPAWKLGDNLGTIWVFCTRKSWRNEQFHHSSPLPEDWVTTWAIVPGHNHKTLGFNTISWARKLMRKLFSRVFGISHKWRGLWGILRDSGRST